MLGRSAVRAVQRTRFSTFALCAILLFGFASAGCSSFPSNNGIRIVDLKISADGPYGWIDNETIVVAIESGESYVRPDGVSVPIKRVAAINYRTGERKYFNKISSNLCFAHGYVSYFFDDRRSSGELFAFYGELGRESTRSIRPGEVSYDRGPGASCRPWSERPKKPDWLTGSIAFRPLSPYFGLINCNVAAATLHTKHIKARFHSPDDKAGVELPFSCYEVFTSLIYHQFKGAYFGLEFDFRSPWPANRDRRIFWVYPDGQTETHVLAYSELIRHNVIPTAQGIIAFSRPTSREGEDRTYLISEGKARILLRGPAAGVTSPNGCKVAVNHDEDYESRMRWGGKKRTTLKVIELCDLGR